MATEGTSDISRFIVTAGNPPRNIDELDYERCAALHNHIIELGWVGSGRSISQLTTVRRTWFEAHGQNAEAAREHLVPSLAKFLELAYVAPRGLRFFYWVENLSIPEDPDQLWGDHGPDFADEGEEKRWLTLYPVNEGLGGHGDGLNYDQKTHKAIMQMDIMYDEITRREDDPPSWHPLETVLSSWIEMIHAGKITPSVDINPPNEKYNPWVNHRFGSGELDEAVNALNELIEAIATRMPGQAQQEPAQDGLLAANALSRAGVAEESFAAGLLTRARRAPFKYIAPGLLVPTADAFAAAQPFTSIANANDSDDDEDTRPIPPVLLFRAENDARYHDGGDDDEPPFDAPYRAACAGMPAGLYTAAADPRSKDVAEGGGVLVLPFRVGGGGRARRSDRSRFDDAAAVFQLGLPAFGGEPRPQRLGLVLRAWRRLVEAGHWPVGGRGVLGGVETFRRADTEEDWRKYWIEPSW